MAEPYFEIETFRRVHDAAGDYIKVGPDGDGLGLIEIEGNEHFGGRIVFDHRMAPYLARAILNTFKDVKAKQLNTK